MVNFYEKLNIYEYNLYLINIREITNYWFFQLQSKMPILINIPLIFRILFCTSEQVSDSISQSLSNKMDSSIRFSV